MKGSFFKSIKQHSQNVQEYKTALRVGGVQPFSAIDYPGHLSTVIFCQGCSWRCRYCQNAHLRSFKKPSELHWNEIIDFLKGHQDLIEGVIFSGGEPLLQPHLLKAVQTVKTMNFKVGLHTGGISLERFKTVLPYLDWVGLDVKAPIEKYKSVTKVSKSGIPTWNCVQALLESQTSSECRTTVHPLLHSMEDIWSIAETLHQMGVRHYAIQLFQEKGCLDKELIQDQTQLPLDANFYDEMSELFDSFIIR